MSPRSEEMIGQARDRAQLAREALFVAGAADFLAAIEAMLADADNGN